MNLTGGKGFVAEGLACGLAECIAPSATDAGRSFFFHPLCDQLRGVATPHKVELDALLQAAWRAQSKRRCPWAPALAVQACHHRVVPHSPAGPEPVPAPSALIDEPHDDGHLPRRALPPSKHHPSTSSQTLPPPYHCPSPTLFA